MAASKFHKTKTPGVYVRHSTTCPRSNPESTVRCRCNPGYRARRGDLGWSPLFTSIAAASNWKATAEKGVDPEVERLAAGPTFGELALLWWTGVEAGSIGKRKGRKDVPYSATTLAGYSRTLRYTLAPYTFSSTVMTPSGFELKPAAELGPEHWQSWVDECARKGLSRSRIANQLAVVSAIYGWASRATRGIVPSNPTTSVEMPPNDEVKRERVATADEAARLLAALHPDDRVPYALAFYAGLRRSEIHRLQWGDVDFEGMRLTVRQSKSEAGTGRQPPIAAPLVPILVDSLLAYRTALAFDGGTITAVAMDPQGIGHRAQDFPVSPVSVMSGNLAERARKAWTAEYESTPTDLNLGSAIVERVAPREPQTPIGLHECRHTYASLLVAAGYNVKEVMEYLGHSDLTTTSRYVKRLPSKGEAQAADKLNAYLEES